jgi:hypothetical protein
MKAYDDRQLFTVTLQHIHQPGPDKPSPVFIAVISAVDLAHARREADDLVGTLNGLVRVVDIVEGGTRGLSTISL